MSAACQTSSIFSDQTHLEKGCGLEENGRYHCHLFLPCLFSLSGATRQPVVKFPAMPTLIEEPVRIEAAGNQPKVIDEFAGAASNGDGRVSIARMESPPGWVEPGQRPEFDEYTLVLQGSVVVTHAGGSLQVQPGQAVLAKAGEWVQYSTPQGARYVAICLPAFSPGTVHRDPD